jgi:hypothetical protein
MWHACGKRCMLMRFWWRNLKEGDHLKDLGVDGSILNWALKRYDGRSWVEFKSIRVGR